MSGASLPIGSLALALTLFATMPDGVLSKVSIHPPLLPPPGNLTCDNIPRPFGVGNASVPDFAVTCGPNMEAMLRIGEDSYTIHSVSPSESFAVILAGPISQVCYDRNGSLRRSTTGPGAAAPMNLEGTPFSFSSRNKLVATGCNYRLIATFNSTWSGYRVPPATAGCSTWCSGSSNAITNGSCTGRACCSASIPMDGTQAFTSTFERMPGHVTNEEFGTCSAAFFQDEDERVFHDRGGQRSLKDALVQVGRRGMVLDWTISHITCEQAGSYNFAPQYFCNNLSACFDAPSGAGYLCRCRAGYFGNPYAADGCIDINECRGTRNNNCSRLCNNTPGGYTCSCPKGMIGDGYRNGTGCNYTALPSGSHTPEQPQGSPTPEQPEGRDACTYPENNPCTYPKRCFYGQGTILCTCPDGMNGNGRKKGSGCKRHSTLDIALGSILYTWHSTSHYSFDFSTINATGK